MSANPSGNSQSVHPHLSSGAVFLVGAQLAGLALSVVNLLLLPRFLGPSVWGVYVVWLSLWGLATQILESGGAVVMNRYLPILRNDHPERIAPFQRGLLLFKLGLAIMIWGVGWWVLVRPDTSDIYGNLSAYTLVIFSAFLFSWACLDAGLQYNFQNMLTYGIFSPLTLLFRLGMVLVFCHYLNQAGVPPGFFFGVLLLWFVYQVKAQRLLSGLPRSGGLRVYFPAREYLEFGLWVGLGQMGFLSTARFPGIAAEMLGFPRVEIGAMGIALLCFTSLRVLPNAISSSLLPHLVSLNHSARREEFSRCISEGWRYTNLFLFWLLEGLLTLSPAWFPLLLGFRYDADMPLILSLLLWITPAVVFGVWLHFFQQVAYAEGKRKAFVWGALLVLAAFPIALFLSPERLGIMRLVLSLGVSMGVGAFIMGFSSHRVQGLVKSALVPLGVFLLLFIPARHLPPNPWLMLVVFVVIQTPLYFLLHRGAGLIYPADLRRFREVIERIGR